MSWDFGGGCKRLFLRAGRCRTPVGGKLVFCCHDAAPHRRHGSRVWRWAHRAQCRMGCDPRLLQHQLAVDARVHAPLVGCRADGRQVRSSSANVERCGCSRHLRAVRHHRDRLRWLSAVLRSHLRSLVHHGCVGSVLVARAPKRAGGSASRIGAFRTSASSDRAGGGCKHRSSLPASVSYTHGGCSAPAARRTNAGGVKRPCRRPANGPGADAAFYLVGPGHVPVQEADEVRGCARPDDREEQAT